MYIRELECYPVFFLHFTINAISLIQSILHVSEFEKYDKQRGTHSNKYAKQYIKKHNMNADCESWSEMGG